MKTSMVKVYLCVMGMVLGIGVPGQAAPVNIPDVNLKAAIETELGVTDPEPDDMLALTYLNASNKNITDLTGLETAANLTWLALFDNQINDISPLVGITNLTWLELSNNQISDISPLAGLTNLTNLTLGTNQISDISPLVGMTMLTCLDLRTNQISDLTPLAGMTNLTYLDLGNNTISDLTPLAGLTNLTSLYLHSNQISDISPLSVLTNLKYLYLSNNQISDLSPLTGMTKLTDLFLHNNQISNLSSLTGLTNLTSLSLYYNQIFDISPLSGLTNLMYLDLSTNQISNVSYLEGLTNLTYLYLSSNQISDISPLTAMMNLQNLYLSNNPLGSDAYYRMLQIEANNPGINLQSDLDPPDSNVITIAKMTVKAAKTRTAAADSFTVSGTFDAAPEDFTATDSVYVSVGLYDQTIDCEDFKQSGKKSKYTYKGAGSITSLILDMNKGTFKIIAKNIDLTGSSSPMEVWLSFGEYVGIGEATEEVINARKYLPLQLQSGYADNLRVEKVVCKRGKENNVGNLVISGSIATADDIDLRTASLLLHWGTSEHAIGLGEFALKGKTKYQYKKKPDDLNPAAIAISIDPIKCTFQVKAKNTAWPWQNSPVTFGLEFGTFNETEEVSF